MNCEKNNKTKSPPKKQHFFSQRKDAAREAAVAMEQIAAVGNMK